MSMRKIADNALRFSLQLMRAGFQLIALRQPAKDHAGRPILASLSPSPGRFFSREASHVFIGKVEMPIQAILNSG
jgi:hypothetical protein